MFRNGDNNIFGISGSNFNSGPGSSPGNKKVIQRQTSDEKLSTPAKQMEHMFAKDLKMARENSMVGNYSISV